MGFSITSRASATGASRSPGPGITYYGYRYYDPETGRWLSRDPLCDAAFFALYSAGSKREQTRIKRESLRASYLFVRNRPIGAVDRLGLVEVIPGNKLIDKKWKIINIGGGVGIAAYELGFKFGACCAMDKGDEFFFRTPSAVLGTILLQPALQAFIRECPGSYQIVTRFHKTGTRWFDCKFEYRIYCMGEEGPPRG